MRTCSSSSSEGSSLACGLHSFWAKRRASSFLRCRMSSMKRWHSSLNRTSGCLSSSCGKAERMSLMASSIAPPRTKSTMSEQVSQKDEKENQQSVENV